MKSFNTHTTKGHFYECLPDDVIEPVACGFVGSRLDYFNSLCARMSETNFARLERVHNTLAYVVTGHKRSDHITLRFWSIFTDIRKSGQPAYLFGRWFQNISRRVDCDGLLRTSLQRMVQRRLNEQEPSRASPSRSGTVCRWHWDTVICKHLKTLTYIAYRTFC